MKKPRALPHVSFALLISSIAMTMAVTGCTSGLKFNAALADANDPAIVQAFEAKLNAVVAGIKNDSSYHRIRNGS